MKIRSKKLVVTVAAGAIVAMGGGVAWAAFSGQGQTTANSRAASVDVELSGATLSSENCENLLPGESCGGTFTATNTGTVSETFVARATSSSTCYTSTATVPAGTSELGDAHADHDKGAVVTGTIVMTLKSDAGNECQGVGNLTTVTVDAVSSQSPRD